jgi:ornithine decarboxylase
MDFFRRFTFLVCAPAFDADDLEGARLAQIIAAIEQLGFQVVRARRLAAWWSTGAARDWKERPRR